MSESLVQLLHDFLKIHQADDKTFWIAYSGGLDSTALLFLVLAARLGFSFNVGAIHINHAVNPMADEWGAHCRSICFQHNVQFIEKKIEINPNSRKGFEAEAREKRYQAIASIMQENDMLLTAHHENDQAETLLLQLLRGAGTRGLSGMPPIKPFIKGLHARPLLNVKRSELEAYVDANKLSYLNDDSNLDRKYARNFLRLEVMPLLESRYPALTTVIARTATHLQQSEVLLEEYALELLIHCKGLEPDSLSVSQLLKLNDAKQQLVLRTWIAQLGYPLPDSKRLQLILQEVLLAATDRQPCMSFANTYEIRRFRDDLMVVKAAPKMPFIANQLWDLTIPLSIPTLGVLSARLEIGRGLLTSAVTVRFRLGGEKISLGTRGNKTLKNMLQEWGVQTFMRERLPLLYIGEQLVCVVGYYIDERFQAKGEEMGFYPHLIVSS